MGLIPDNIIAQVIDRCDIVETIGSYIPLKRAGRNFKALCPFHNEKTPSFLVNPDKQIFHCFGCGAGGNVVSFVMQQERHEFPEALRMLAAKVGITIPETNTLSAKTSSERELIYKINELALRFFHNTLLKSEDEPARQAKKHLIDRGISLDTAKELKLGFAPERWDALLTFLRSKDISLKFIEKAGLIVAKENRDGYYDRFRNRIIFPIFDSRSRCVAFGARAMKEGIAKYINSPETTLYTKGKHLYGFHLAKEAVGEKDCVIVVEGYLDFISPFQAGVRNIAASLGTALTIDQIRLIRRYTPNIIMLFDSDAAGASAVIRSLDVLIEEGINVKVATLKSGEDPDSFVRKFGVNEFNSRIEKAQSLFDYKLNKLLAKHSHKSVEGKAKISAEMLPTIKKFENAVVKFSYVKQLAEVLAVPQEVLLVELQKVIDRPTYGREPVSAKVFAEPERIRPIERNLLKLMLIDPENILSIKEEVSASDFHDETVRLIVTEIYKIVNEGKVVNVSNLMNRFEDQNISKLLSQLAAPEDHIMDNKDRIRQDYVNRIKKDKLSIIRKNLCQKIKDAETTGDNDRLIRLTQELNQLIKN